jgi:cytochrome c peroxidase
MDLFFADDVGCAKCHGGVNFSGPWRDATSVTGRAALANNGLGLFKVPTLRNIGLTAPYMHDGRFATLSETLTHYSELASVNAQRDPRLPRRPLTQSQRQDLTAFLHALTDSSFAKAATAKLLPDKIANN